MIIHSNIQILLAFIYFNPTPANNLQVKEIGNYQLFQQRDEEDAPQNETLRYEYH